MTVVQSFPLEVWQHIYTFLPPQDLRAIYSLNRALLELSFSERYREVAIKPRKMEESRYNSYLKHLSQPHIVTFIRSLDVSLDFASGETTPSISLFQRYLQPKRKQSIWTRMSRLPVASHAPLLRALRNSESIPVVHLRCPIHSESNENEIVSFLSLLRESIQHSTRTLYITASQDHLRLFTDSMSAPPSLENLTVIITDSLTKSEPLINLVNSFARSLQALTLQISQSSSESQLDSLFSNLKVFPQLTNLTFLGPVVPKFADTRGGIQLSRFLGRNPSITRPFAPSMTTTPERITGDGAITPIPPFVRLVSLELDHLPQSGTVSDLSLSQAIKHTGPFLRRLDLGNDKTFETREAIGFIRKLDLRPEILSELHIRTWALTPEFLHFVSTEFPRLEFLHVHIKTVLPLDETSYTEKFPGGAYRHRFNEDFVEFIGHLHGSTYSMEGNGVMHLSVTFFDDTGYDVFDPDILKTAIPRLETITVDFETPSGCCMS